MIIEINMLKNCLPSNLNRDESGMPKTCTFGGVKRSRISSQCLKRSWRCSPLFQNELGKDLFSIRTRKMPDIVAQRLVASGVDEEVANGVKSMLSSFGKNEDKPTDDAKTPTVIMYSPGDIDAITSFALDAVTDKTLADVQKMAFKKELEAFLKENTKHSSTVDMALWGRMVTSDALADMDGAMKVSHAISTNKAVIESDFFTTIDDCLVSGEEFGAGMMDYVDYTSACYYIYASVDTDMLLQGLSNAENSEEIARKVLPALIKTMAFTSPSGKQNSFATAALPAAVLIEIKDQKVATDYASAFEVPVRADFEHSLSHNSAKQLADTCNLMQQKFNLPVSKRLWFCVDDDITINNADVCKTFDELLAGLDV